MARKLFIAANWKMYKTCDDAEETMVNIESLVDDIGDIVDIVVFPTFASLQTLGIMTKRSNVMIGAQDIHYGGQGAFTGEVCADIARSTGAGYVIIGHSERRTSFNETDEVVNRKVLSALDSGLVPVVCVGDTLDQRKVSKSEEVVSRQLKGALEGVKKAQAQKLIIAYEPVWAISTSGTGIVATPEEAEEMHSFIRSILAELYDRRTADDIRIIYGGSVRPENAEGLLSIKDIDGALIGGASLYPDSFSEVCHIAKRIMKKKR
jgi:triosephosphate isomerase